MKKLIISRKLMLSAFGTTIIMFVITLLSHWENLFLLATFITAGLGLLGAILTIHFSGHRYWCKYLRTQLWATAIVKELERLKNWNTLCLVMESLFMNMEGSVDTRDVEKYHEALKSLNEETLMILFNKSYNKAFYNSIHKHMDTKAMNRINSTE